METKLLTYILIGIIGILGFTLVKDRYINPPSQQTGVPDTVYVDKPFKVETIRKADEIIPAEITIYETEYTSLEFIKIVTDTVKIYPEGEDNPILYNTRFLTNYTTAPKFLGMELKEDFMSLTTLSPQGETMTKSWSLNLAQNSYRIAPDGNGGVNMTDDKRYSFFGLRFKYHHSLLVGASWALEDGQFQNYPLIRYNPEFEFFHQTRLSTSVGLVNENLTGEVGIKYIFR